MWVSFKISCEEQDQFWIRVNLEIEVSLDQSEVVTQELISYEPAGYIYVTQHKIRNHWLSSDQMRGPFVRNYSFI